MWQRICVLEMSDYCIVCLCEPIESEGWKKSVKYPDEWVCPWCIREDKFI